MHHFITGIRDGEGGIFLRRHEFGNQFTKHCLATKKGKGTNLHLHLIQIKKQKKGMKQIN